MKSQEKILQNAGESYEFANQYIQKQVELFKLDSAEKIAKSTSSIVTVAVLAFLVTMVIIMLSITIGLWLGSILESYALAFFVITILYALFAALVYKFKRQMVTNPVLTMVISSFYD